MAKVSQDMIPRPFQADGWVKIPGRILKASVLKRDPYTYHMLVLTTHLVLALSIPSSSPFFVNRTWFVRKFIRQPTVSPVPYAGPYDLPEFVPPWKIFPSLL